MTPFDQFLQFLVAGWRLDVAILAKLGVWLFLLLYLGFSLVVVRQVKLMSHTVNGFLENQLSIMAWALVLLAVAVFIFSLFFL
ncbi:hypothetical protein A3I57_00820 [Candidatus Beckwithbacteria bacterium RIFCSPLOWO2_02_FULL_47_23]|uniref:Uncharacterized protein n=1 Tax=Candidatus Beckwithbacteria bacterium RIFCSPLOWO2_02_FULL_47_23 TaxID=1797463 RepID=A0A1F5DS18_9BACT|nr:MAG: hypothetical protein A3I57_00820 [Candidatus Beckwithbacteria bacterium RIFCSPLOWO2_02_FULL_47_23]